MMPKKLSDFVPLEKRSARGRSSLAGFTLIEILISTAISVVIIAGVYSAYQAGIVSYRRLDSAFIPYQQARNIFNRMELDVRNSFGYSSDDARFAGGKQNLTFFAVCDAFEEGKEFRDLYRIKYDALENLLRRTVYANEDALKDDTVAVGLQAAYTIKELVFSYAYKPTDSTQGIQWRESWPQDESRRNELPLAIKIKLSLDSRGEVLVFNKLIALP
jgi:prepilin-type N-terminal cleavage/methylation domain-containing protein